MKKNLFVALLCMVMCISALGQSFSTSITRSKDSWDRNVVLEKSILKNVGVGVGITSVNNSKFTNPWATLGTTYTFAKVGPLGLALAGGYSAPYYKGTLTNGHWSLGLGLTWKL